MSSSPITNVFVVVLENRAFDHMLGFSGITGTDAVTQQPTSIIGLTGSESNSGTYQGNTQSYTVSQPAAAVMPVDPGHEFLDVLIQLSGPNASYPSGGKYPAIDNSGFVADYIQSPSSGEGNATSNFGEIMECYSSAQLPVLNALATEFAVCDNWFASMPGPTWPNRFFAHGASSASLDHSPTTPEIIKWELDGFSFPNGSIFDAIAGMANGQYRLYFDGDFSVLKANLPIVSALKGIHIKDVHKFSDFANDLQQAYPYMYTYIEPSYGDVASGTYEGGSSQHPLDGVTNGEAFLQSVYAALRASPIWDTSLLIVTWDEHGGFYDHFAPNTPAVAPGDAFQPQNSMYQFNFVQYGVRVPAVVVSPLIPLNLIDHRTYDHSSIPATLEAIFGISSLTQRDANANNVTPLVSLTSPRSTPLTMPNPATPDPAALAAAAKARAERALRADAEPADSGSLPSFLYLAMRYDAQLSGPGREEEIRARVAKIRTRANAKEYLAEVNAKAQARANS